MKKGKKKIMTYAKTTLCMTLCAAMILADAPMEIFAEETLIAEEAAETVTAESGEHPEAQGEISVENGVKEELNEAAEADDRTEENAVEQGGKTDTDEELTADEAEVKTEEVPTEAVSEDSEITEIKTETEESSTEAAESETEASEKELKEGASDESSDEVIASGEYKEDGNNITWVIDADGKLTVEGTGDFAPDLPNYDSFGVEASRAPWAQYCKDITSAVINVEGMTNARGMFGSEGMLLYPKLTTIDVSNFDTSKVADMCYMFGGCNALTSIDVSNFDTSNVTGMRGMFAMCQRLTSLDISKWDTSQVTDMGYMFHQCQYLTSLDTSHFDTSKVTDMRYMFSNCSSLSSIDLSKFDTSKVTNMKNMFHYCSSLESLDISNFNTSKVTDMNWIFGCCFKLSSLDLSNFDTGSVTDMHDMFYESYRLESLDISGFDTSKVTDMNYMFGKCNSLSSLDVSKWDTSQVTTMREMFYGCSSLSSLDVSKWDTSRVTDMNHMFSGCSSLNSLDVSHFDTSNVTDMTSMFTNCSSLSSLDVSHFDTSQVTSMGSMFINCSSLSSLDVSHFDTSQVTDMNWMFGNMSLSSLDISNFDTSKVYTMSCMFNGCSSLTSLDLSNFDTSQVTGSLGNMTNMFQNCNSLNVIYTPRNVKVNAALDGTWKDTAGNTYTALPKEQPASILIYRSTNQTGYEERIFAKKQNLCFADEPLDKDDMIVIYYGADGTAKILEQTEYTTNEAEIDLSSLGTKTLTVTYKISDEKTLTADILLTVKKRFDNTCVTVTLPDADTYQYAYDGKEKKPEPTVSYTDTEGGTTVMLTKNTDYTVVYKNNVNAYRDTANAEQTENAPTVIIKGRGDYSGTVAMTFEIPKAPAPESETLTQEVTNFSAQYSCFVSIYSCFKDYQKEKTGCTVGEPIEDDTISGKMIATMPTVNDGLTLLSCKLNAGTAGDFVTIPVTFSFVNYEDAVLYVKIMFVGTTTDIKKTVKISGIEVKDATYNQQPVSYTGTAKVTEDSTDLTNTVNLTYTYSGTQADGSAYTATSTAPTNAGDYKLTVAVAADNQSYTGSEVYSFKIAKAPLVVTARDMGLKIGEPLPQSTDYKYDTTGLLGSDKLTAEPTLTCNITDTSAAGTYDIIPTGADAGMNYEITYKNGKLTVSETGESAVYYTVTFSLSGKGSDIINTGVKEGDTVERPQNNPTADGYAFTGWYKDESCTVLWDFEKDTIQSDTTIYAGWEKSQTGGNDGDDEDAFPVEWEYPTDLNVARTTLTADNIEVKAKKRIYDGTPYTPDIKVTVADEKGKKTVLTDGTDYTVKYSNNVNAGENTGKVTVKGNGAYTGTLTKNFTITQKPVKKLKTVAGGMIVGADVSSELSKVIYVYDGTKQLTYNVDYTLSVTKGDTTQKGKLEVAVSAKDGSNYTGTGKDAAKATVTVYEATGKNFKGIINPEDVAFEKTSDVSQTYTGKALKPTFKVTVDGTELGKKDFSVKYTNNKEAGTAYATITGKGGYVGSVVKTFDIKPVTVSESSKLSLKKEIKAPTYNGKVQKPKVTITSGTKTLKAGKDYRISYSNNLHATPENAADKDKAKITVTGIGNYKGMNGTFYFEIKPLEIKKAQVKGTQNNLDITYAKHPLIKGYDYEIIEITPDGKKAKVTLTGKGDFTGTVTKKVNIQ